MQDFKDKVAVITGGASGVGKAIGMRLGQAGARLVLADIEEPKLDETVAEARAAGIDAIGHVTDVTSLESVEALADRAFGHYGAAHLVFNNAGVGGGGGPVWEIPAKTWQWILNVNIMGVVNGMQVFMPRLIEQNQPSHLINTTSGVGLLATTDSPAYGASKAAVIALTESAYLQVTQQQLPVKISLLFPGPHIVATGLYDSDRNRPQEFAVEQSGPDIKTAEDLREVVKQYTGRTIQITPPEEFAEFTYQALLEDRFWIRPPGRGNYTAVLKDYFDSILAGTDPAPVRDIL